MFRSDVRMIVVGVLIVMPSLFGALLDLCFSVFPTFTFVGAAFSIVELAERLLNRTSAVSIQWSGAKFAEQEK